MAQDDHRWLTAAIELSRRSPPARTHYAVGAIVVGPDGTRLAAAYTGERDPHDHAEEAALASLPATGLSRSTLYSSLEPCTTRRSRPGTCTDLILAAGIRRVVIALREPPVLADCRGVETLRAAGVTVVELGELGDLVRQINAHVLIGHPRAH